jgi:hypothetical protein
MFDSVELHVWGLSCRNNGDIVCVRSDTNDTLYNLFPIPTPWRSLLAHFEERFCDALLFRWVSLVPACGSIINQKDESAPFLHC